MTENSQPKPTPAERVTQIAASDGKIYLLTSDGRVFYAEHGRKALGWTELPLPEVPVP